LKTIILNELEFAENIISTGALGESPMFALICVGRYYISQGLGESDICDRLHALVDKNGKFHWSEIAAEILTACRRRTLLEISNIPVAESEFLAIKKLGGLQRQRLLFVLLVLAKYHNFVKHDNDNWVKYEFRHLFSLANISVSKIKQCLYINDLMQTGAIEYRHRVDSLDLRVLVLDDTTPAVANVYDMRNLGFQYMMHIGMPFFACTSCGITTKRTAGKQKYCPACASAINAQKTMERYYAKHNIPREF